MSELGPTIPETEKTDVVLQAVDPILNKWNRELQNRGIDVGKNEDALREMLVEAFEAGIGRHEE